MTKRDYERHKGVILNSLSKNQLPHSFFLQTENREYGVCDIYMVFVCGISKLCISCLITVWCQLLKWQ